MNNFSDQNKFINAFSFYDSLHFVLIFNNKNSNHNDNHDNNHDGV